LFINHQFTGNTTLNTAFFLTKGKGYYEQYKADESFSKYGLPDFVSGNETITETDLVRQLWLENDFYGQIFSLQNKGNNHQLTFGGGWNRYDGNHFGKITWAEAGIPNNYTWYDLEAYKTDVNVFGKYQQRIAKGLELFADLQYRRVLYNITGFRDNPSLKIRETYNFFNPKFGLSYSRHNYQWYASYSLGQKEPNRDDFEAGQNQVPKPEKLHDIEFGVEKKEQLYRWGATFYYMLYKDQLVLTGKINDVGAYTRVNIPNSYRMGIELQASAVINYWLNLGANFTVSRNRVKDFVEYYDDYDNGGQKTINHGNTDIAYSPSGVGSVSINFLPVKNLEISLPGKYVGRQFLDNTSNKARSLDPFFVQDARVSYSLRKLFFREINLVFQVNNVFDKKYEPNGYTFSYQYGGSLVTENYYFPMAGINFMVAVNVKL
jgi:iron complex outermembrane recepter protein